MNNFFESCAAGLTKGGAMGEILFMLFIAALLGWLLRHFMGGWGSAAPAAQGVAMSSDDNDLKVVEGIGPKIEELLKDGGINTWADLAAADTDRLQEILTNAGSRFKMHDPRTWAEQAGLARDGQWDDLQALQDFLEGGKE